MDKKYYTHSQINSLTDQLVDKIITSGIKFTAIVGIARGGLPIMERLNKKLNLPSYSIKISFYKDSTIQSEPIVEMNNFIPNDKELYLIVDDLIDSGATFNYISKNFNIKYKSAVLFWNPQSSVPKPDFYAENHKGKWVVFPWEVKHELKICPLCNQYFECKIGDINNCQCSKIILNDKETSYIKDKFTDCLCITCINKLKNEYSTSKN
jgi:hypoxanthine phosphoribosyltransferase